MISKRAITGLDVTVLIACAGRSRMVTTLELADSTGLSVSNLEQILKQLKVNEIVKSVKGPGGGYQLCADLEQLTVLDLVKIFDKSNAPSKGEQTITEGDQLALVIDSASIENSFIALIEEFLASQKLIDLVRLLPQWNLAEPATVKTGRFKLKDPPPRIIPRSPNSVFQLSAFMSSPAFG